MPRLHDTACYRRCGTIATKLSRLDASENLKVVRCCRTQASSHNSQGVVDGGIDAAGMSTAAPDRSVVRSFDWLVSRIFKWYQIVAMALWNCFSENICLFVCLFIKMKTTFSFKHKALDVCESSPARCVEQVYTNPPSAHPPLFVHLAQKTGN